MQNILFCQGSFYRKLFVLKHALYIIKKVLGIKLDYSKTVLQGKTYKKRGMQKKAIHAFEQAIHINPDGAEAYYHLGNLYKDMGKFKEAIQAYKLAISKKSRYADAIYNLGIAYSKAGMFKEAIEITKRLTKLNPHLSVAHKNLSMFYGSLGLLKEAAESMKQVVRLEPEDADSHYKLALLFLKSHDKASAIKEYEILKVISPTMAGRLSIQFT